MIFNVGHRVVSVFLGFGVGFLLKMDLGFRLGDELREKFELIMKKRVFLFSSPQIWSCFKLSWWHLTANHEFRRPCVKALVTRVTR